MSQTREQAEMLATRLTTESVQFQALPFELIASTILQVVQAIVNAPCFGRRADGETAMRYVKGKYDPDSARKKRSIFYGYNPALVSRLTNEAMDAAERQGQELSPLQAHELAVKTLDEIRTGSRQTMSAIIEEIRSGGVDDGGTGVVPQPHITDAGE